MKLKHIYFFLLPIAAGILLFAAFSANYNANEEPDNKEVIKFSHSFHIEQTDCETCHAVTGSTSLKDRVMPSHENCGTCHEVDNEDECNTCHYDGVFEPLTQKKSNLIFNHSYHVDKKELKCVDCHKGLDEVDYSWEASQPFPMMENCYTCHSNIKQAPNACETCHLSTAELKPQSHKSSSFISLHKFSARSIEANCVMCHDDKSCEDCHVANRVMTETNTSADFFQPYSPTNNGLDGIKQQKITRVHDLNYRFTHGIDAKGKNAECQTCHEVETFCSTCHQANNADYSIGGVAPASHLKPNFTTIGVGTGGGEHAILARRDIESCAACHDVQGADPTCITCHLDSDGIQGTNPQTHPRNFMRDIKGDWHDSQGSICYNCHNGSPQAPAGIGFCGYCHGANEH